MLTFSDFPKKINFGLQENACNLACPKCLVHSESYPRGIELKKSLGIMQGDSIIKVLDEVKEHRPTLSPSFWSEGLLNKKLFKMFVEEARARELPVEINTNALLITDEVAEFMVKHLDQISISIDAVNKETLVKTRATDELEKIKKAVFLLLEKRGDRLRPRVVVSFSVEESNLDERDEFVEYWTQHVDAVRINEVYSDDRKIQKEISAPERYPCREIYDSMTIDYNGDVRICCLDGYRETNLGNVFKDSVYSVWHGEELQRIREVHETNNYEKYKFCQTCEQWAGFKITKERMENQLLVRGNDFTTYYNRVDRLDTWSNESKRDDLLIDHNTQEPPINSKP
jgi:radical SAM protein with 4Fe4S-binding SPASM domain